MTDEDPTPPRDPVPEPVATPADPGPFAAILWFLEECRLRGYQVGPVIEHDGTRVQVRDIRQARLEGAGMLVSESDIWEDHGHPMRPGYKEG